MGQRSVISIAVLVIALMAGCAKKANDAALVTSIQSQMFSDPELKDANVQVTASQGKVTLSGTVPNDAAHLEAYKIATQTAGVVRVNDQIAVEEPKPAAPAEEAPTTRKRNQRRRDERARKARVELPAPTRARPRTELTENSQAPAAAESAPAPPVVSTPRAATAPSVTATTPPPPPTAPQPKQVAVPAGTTLRVQMVDSIDSAVDQPGEIFHASLDAPVVVGNQVVVSKGADVYVRLVNANSAGRLTGKSELSLELVKLEFQGQSYPLVSNTYTLSGSSRGVDTAKKVGIGAVLGTLIGAIAGGGKGAAIGAGVGAAGGGAYQVATHGKQVRIPSETKLDFQLDQPVSVTVLPQSAPASN